jgi:hypothetical protein
MARAARTAGREETAMIDAAPLMGPLTLLLLRVPTQTKLCLGSQRVEASEASGCVFGGEREREERNLLDKSSRSSSSRSSSTSRSCLFARPARAIRLCLVGLGGKLFKLAFEDTPLRLPNRRSSVPPSRGGVSSAQRETTRNAATFLSVSFLDTTSQPAQHLGRSLPARPRVAMPYTSPSSARLPTVSACTASGPLPPSPGSRG